MKKRLSYLLTALICIAVLLCSVSVFAESQANESTTEGVLYAHITELARPDTNHVYFGSYPQTEIVSEASQCGTYDQPWETTSDYIVDAALYSTLQSATWDTNGDTVVKGDKYHRIKKSDATYGTSGSVAYYNWSDGTTYHYFKYEPIKWRILKLTENDVFLLSEGAIDDQQYNNTSTSVTWENSTLRSWLNSNFYNMAFTAAEQSLVKTTDVVNANTKDKVFILSEDEVENTDYGFESSYKTYDEARKMKSSTYAKAMGVTLALDYRYKGCCMWWLRSPSSSSDIATEYVDDSGDIDRSGYDVGCHVIGILPALHINLKSNNPITACEIIKDITLSSDTVIYTGKELEPDVTIKGLTEGEDYTVKYSNNIEAGTAKAIVTGIGNCSGTISKTFEIKRDIAKEDFELSETEFTYSGEENTPTVISETLTEGVDYTVSYSDNVNVGTATVHINSMGKCVGYNSKTFTIKPYRFAKEPTTEGLLKILTVLDQPEGDSKHVYFGSYPQTEIVSEASQCGTYGKSWATAGDYIVDANLYSTLQGETWDANGDTVVKGAKYHRIKKSDATYSASADTSYYNWSDDTTYHYFKYEPIKWRILKLTDNDVFLLSEGALDDQAYNTTKTSITWEDSTVRSWLNSSFYNMAFSYAEQVVIKTTDVVNSNNKQYETAGGNDTKDKIFLLSEDEVYGEIATQYGFAKSYNANDKARQMKSSTYAKAMGVYSTTEKSYSGDGWWWLRSPGDSTLCAAYVNTNGSIVRFGFSVRNLDLGILPALHINLSTNNPITAYGTIADISLSSELEVYTGKEIKPSVTIEGLTEDTDYTVKYSNNVEAGTATVTVTGKGAWSGTISKTFEIIDGKDISLEKSEYAYDGTAHCPKMIIKDGNGNKLVEGTDYDLQYSNNTEVGVGTVSAKLKDNYTGTITTHFRIGYEIEDEMTISPTEFMYDGTEKKPTVTWGSLVEGTDFTVEYSDNVYVGTATVKAVGIGQYVGSASKTFEIKSNNILSGVVTGYSGSKLKLVLRDSEGKEQTSTSANYTFANIVPGTYTLIASADGDYVQHEYTLELEGKMTQDITLYQLGDTNCDGVRSAEDITRLARHIAKISEESDSYKLKLFNTDRNEDLNAADITHLARFVAKIIEDL